MVPPAMNEPRSISSTDLALKGQDCGPITVVTGLPRSGTSMLMQMLVAGGCRALVDHRRPADVSNPQGYFEYEPVTRLHSDAGWLSQARGRVIKVVAPLLRFLPLAGPDREPFVYRVVFSRRDPARVVTSQLRMLRNLGREDGAPPESKLITAMLQELDVADRWVRLHAGSALHVDYEAVIRDPMSAAQRLAAFIPGLDPARAGGAVIPPPGASRSASKGLRS